MEWPPPPFVYKGMASSSIHIQCKGWPPPPFIYKGRDGHLSSPRYIYIYMYQGAGLPPTDNSKGPTPLWVWVGCLGSSMDCPLPPLWVWGG